MTAISPLVATTLGSKPFSRTEVHFGNETKVVPVYKVDIFLPNSVGVIDVNATEAVNIKEADLLLGMDIINMGDFAVTNAGGTTFFSFRFPPAAAHTDYVKQSQVNTQAQGSAHDRQNLIRNLDGSWFAQRKRSVRRYAPMAFLPTCGASGKSKSAVFAGGVFILALGAMH